MLKRIFTFFTLSMALLLLVAGIPISSVHAASTSASTNKLINEVEK